MKYIYWINHYIFNQLVYHGEIYIGGLGVGNGYINNVEANKNNFVTINNKRLYKTGDLAKWNLDGTITFIGRIDNQVKISGYRIELNEINNCINQYESVSAVFTTLLKNSHLVSYFIAKSTVDTKELSDYLRSKLPFYMVPKFLMQLEIFPLTPNGKIDAKKLPLPMVDTNMTYVAPENELEKKIAQILVSPFISPHIFERKDRDEEYGSLPRQY